MSRFGCGIAMMMTANMTMYVRTIDVSGFQKIREEYGSFDDYLWGHSDGKTILYNKHSDGYIPVSNGLSDMISKDLKKRGFKYLGTVTMYSHLQACGIINDHSKSLL